MASSRSTATCISSWDDTKQQVDTNPADGAASCSPATAARWTDRHAELRYLGHGETESYGLSWRTEGSGGHIEDSIISHLYFGLYCFEVGGLDDHRNEVHDSVLYGIDPHTGSHDLKIQSNVVHDNGKHGIILAEDCVDSVICDNIVYRNQHHGIVLYLHSDRNTIENNETFQNPRRASTSTSPANNVVRSNGSTTTPSPASARAERQRQPLGDERHPRQRAGRRAAGQLGDQGGRAGQRDRRERPLRGLHRRAGPFTLSRQHHLRQPHRPAAKRHSSPIPERTTRSSTTTKWTSRTAGRHCAR